MINPIGDRDALVSALRLIASEPVMNDRFRAILIGGLGSTNAPSCETVSLCFDMASKSPQVDMSAGLTSLVALVACRLGLALESRRS